MDPLMTTGTMKMVNMETLGWDLVQATQFMSCVNAALGAFTRKSVSTQPQVLSTQELRQRSSGCVNAGDALTRNE